MSKKRYEDGERFTVWMNTEIRTEMKKNFSQEQLDSYFTQFFTDEEYAKMKKFGFWILLGQKSICIATPDKQGQEDSIKNFNSLETLRIEYAELIKSLKKNYFSTIIDYPENFSDLVISDYVFENFKRHILESIENNVEYSRNVVEDCVNHQLPLDDLIRIFS